MKVPVLELQLKEDGSEQRTLYQFGIAANVSEIVAAVEEQVKHHRKAE
jgi:hypothetical protein